jgi:PAS domain S-box-containing protein
MLGYSAEEMLGGSFTDFMDPSWKEKSLPMWNRRMAGVVEQHDFKFRRKDGEDLWALLSASPMVDQNGEFMGALAMVTDITERREMEDRLRNNLQFLEILVNTIPSPVFYKDINGVYLGCNKAFADLMGVSHENIVGKTVYQVAPEDMAAIYAQKDEQLLATGGVQIYEGQTRDHFGHYHEVIFYKSTFPDQHGNLAGIIGIALDITERKQTEKALEDSNRTLQTTLSTIPIGIGLARNRRIVWVNQSYIDLFGFESMDECRDLHASTLYKNPEDYERVGELYDKLSDGAPREIDIQWLKKDGSTFQGHLAMKALSASDPLEGVIFAITDISWRKRAEELILQSERLKAIGELATGVAHNFNNLLQIMVGGAQIALTELASGDENAAIINLEQILESAKMGSETVKRLQDFARIRTEDVNLKGDLFNLSKTVESAIEMSKPWWKTSPEKEGFSIELVKKLTPEAYIRGNENEIFEVVVNLIKNASEALPQGGVIKITLSMIKDKVRLMVEDNGVGIGEEEKAHLFQPFWTTKGYSGTGMGLATCYGIVKRHKGEIDVQSAQDLGASFIVTLPASEKPASSKTAINVKDPGIKLNVLVIDDMPAVLKQLDRGLSKLGQTVFTARSGAEGIEIVKETLVDLVVCDLGMPGMNGIRVAREIKSLFERRKVKRPHLIILTGWGGQIHRTEAKAENGVDLILEKPIGSDQLLQKVKEIMADGPLLPPK